MRNVFYFLVFLLVVSGGSYVQSQEKDTRAEMAFVTVFPDKGSTTQQKTHMIIQIFPGYGSKLVSYVGLKGELVIGLYPESGFRQYFRLRGELLITDPQGRRTGYDALNEIRYQEIPNSDYISQTMEDALWGHLPPERKIITIPEPITGEYELKIIGTEKGYHKEDKFEQLPRTKVITNVITFQDGTVITMKEKRDFSGLMVRFYPVHPHTTCPAEPLIIDPRGRKTGYDPVSGVKYSEIPDSSYGTEGIGDAVTGAPGPEMKELEIRQPMDGQYELKVTGMQEGSYMLYIYAIEREGNPSVKEFDQIPISPGTIHTYILNYSKEIDSKIGIRGP
jgi:hypothetical protein